MTSIKLMVVRAIGDNRLNLFLQKYGWRKFKKTNSRLSRIIINNSKYEDLYKGKRCFIIGNGPSLNEQDLSMLHDEYVFTCNQIMRNPIYPTLKSNFHFFADPTFFSLKTENAGDMEVLELMKCINTSEINPVVFFASEGFKFAEDFGLNNILDLHYFVHGLSFTENFDMKMDFTRFVPNLHTVVHYAIAMAIYMGFSKIYLLGCDCTNVVTAANTRLYKGEGAKYAYDISDNEKNRMVDRNSSIRMEDELRSFMEVFRGYRVFYEYAQRRDIEIVNCTQGGLLDCIPRKRYEDVIEGNV